MESSGGEASAARQRDLLLGRLRALQEAALAIAAPVAPTPQAIAELLKRIVERAVASLGAADGAIVLVEDPAWGNLVEGAGPEAGNVTLRHTGQPFRQRWRPEGSTTRVLATGRSVTVEDTAVPSEFGPYPNLVADGVRSFTLVPLLAGGRVLGRLGLNLAAPGPLATEDREALDLFAAHAAAALERVRLVHEQSERAAAEAAVRARDEFLSVAAHELNTPITVLRGYTQLLLRAFVRTGGLDPERSERAVRTIDQQADKLARLVGQLLDVSRLQAGTLMIETERTDVSGLVAEVVAAAQVRAQEHRIVLSLPPQPVSADVDPLRLEQVVVNLLNNAIKFSPEGSRIDVRLSLPAPGRLRLAVRDRGVGVRPEHRAHIFERFYQGDNAGQGSAPRAAGMGLGLYISQQIVSQHGGTIRLQVPRGAGSRFVIILPRRGEAAPPVAAG